MTTQLKSSADRADLRVSSNGSSADSLPLSPPRTRRARTPQALLAALLMVGGGLGGLILFQQYNQRTPAVVLTAPVAQGQVLAREQLAITEVALDQNVAIVGSLTDAVGRLAAHDLEPGELVSPSDLMGEDRLVTASESVIGLLLEPGQYPTTQLAPGDRVDIFAPGQGVGPAANGQFVGNSDDGDAGSSVGSNPSALVSNLVVFDVAESSNDGRTLLVSLIVGNDQAAAVFDAAENSGIRLSLRGLPDQAEETE